MDLDGSRWFSVVLGGSRWFSVVLGCSWWFSVVLGGSRLFSVVLGGSAAEPFSLDILHHLENEITSTHDRV